MRNTLTLCIAILLGSSPYDAPVGALQRGGPTNSGTQVVSPTVAATWLTKPGSELVDLLVLWRGRPGWFLGSHQTGGSQSTANTYSATVTLGTTTLHVEFSRLTRIATLNGVEIKLGANNLVLMDEVDGGKPPEIVGVMTTVDPIVNRSIASVIAKHRRTVDYLRCDVKLPEPGAQELMDHLCGPYKSVAHPPLQTK